jgi:hypothetical protein
MCDLVFSVQEFLKIVPGMVIFPFSLYFAWKKISTKVLASILTAHDLMTAPRISSVVLRNLKDKPLTIFAIYALVNDEVYFEVDRCEPPIIIKALECAQIETRPYSQLTLDGQKFAPDFGPNKNIAIYLVAEKKVIKCKMVTHPDLTANSKGYRHAAKETTTFNNTVYTDDAAFAIVYCVNANSDLRTAIVHRSGLILRDWEFWFNMIPQEHMKSEDDLKSFLEAMELNKATAWFKVHPLSQSLKG